MLFRKPVKKSYIITSIIAILIMSGYVVYRIKKHDFLDHQLQDIVKDKTNQLYKISYDSISVDEVGGDVYIKNIYIKGDTTLLKQMINNADSNAVPFLLDIYVPSLKVVDFKTAAALLSKQLECKQVIISDPTVHIYLFPGQAKPMDTRKNQEELYKQILGNFKLIKADSVSVFNSEVIAADFFSKEVKFQTFNTSVNLSRLAIDSSYNQDTTRTLFCKEISVTSDKIVLGEKENTAEILKATFDTRSKILAFSSFSYDAFKNKGFFKSQLEGISLEGIEWTGPVENSELVIDKAEIKKGEIESLLDSGKENNSKQKQDATILKGWIKRFSLNSLKVRSVNFTSRTTEAKKKPFIVKNNSFSIKNVEINRRSKFDASLVNEAKEIELYNDEISIKSSDNLYEYKVKGIKVNTKNKNLTISSILVIPQLDESAFAKKAHYQTDRYNIKFQKINCSNVNVEKLVKGEVDIDKISSTGSTIKIFHDLSYPLDSISKQGQQMTYPHQIIHKLDKPVRIKTFMIDKAYIEYKEKNAKSKSSGRVRFSNTTVTINNISTHSAKAGEKTTVNFNATFLEKIPVSGGFTFALDEWQKGTFTARAVVSQSFDATILNQLLQPMSLAKVEKGTINSVKFYMTGDTNTSHGTLELPYKDLKISLLKKKENQYDKKGIFSLLANIIVKNNNKEDSDMRTAKVTRNRNKYRSFFNFIWTTIFTGIKDICVLKI